MWMRARFTRSSGWRIRAAWAAAPVPPPQARLARGSGEHPHLPGPQRREPFRCNAARGQRGGEVEGGLLDGLVGETEGAPVVAERLGGAAQLEGLHGVVRVHVAGAHEPARLVGTDGQERRDQARMAPAYAVEG